MLQMIIRNFLNLIKRQYVLVIILVLSQFMAVSIILFAYGTYTANSVNLEAAQGEESKIILDFVDSDENTAAELNMINATFASVMSDYDSMIQYIFPFVNPGKEEMKKLNEEYGIYSLENAFSVLGGMFTVDKNAEYKRKQCGGDWYSDEDIIKGNLVCCAGNSVKAEKGQNITLFGREYTVVAKGIGDAWDPVAVNIPFSAIPGNLYMQAITIKFNRKIVKSEYDEIAGKLVDYFGEENVELTPKKVVELEIKQTFRSLIYISVLMGIISAFTVFVLYRFVLEERMHMTAVYEICGCTRFRAALIFLSEMLGILVVNTLLAYLLYMNVIRKKLEQMIPWFRMHYLEDNSRKLVMIYFVIIVVTILATLMVSLKKTPREILKEEC